jgi:predicted acylesterase/phospholipase RssA
MLGLIKALRDEGIDLGDSDLIVGTSAGARVGAQLASGNLEDGVASYRDARVPELELAVPFEVFAAAVRRIVTEARQTTSGETGSEPRAARLAPRFR